jgi:small subunit ribosomal protein S20
MEDSLAHHKSAKKRIKTDAKRRLRNRSVKSRVKTFIRYYNEAFTAALEDEKGVDSHKETVQKHLTNVISEYQKATTKGVIHRNTSSRRIGRLQLRFNKHFAG